MGIGLKLFYNILIIAFGIHVTNYSYFKFDQEKHIEISSKVCKKENSNSVIITLTDYTEPYINLMNSSPLVDHTKQTNFSDPIKVDWNALMNIEYKLKYYEELDMEAYAPVFPDSVEILHGKSVILEGFIIPFDDEGEFLSLSYNPYASCYFCGNASPASVLSMYLKDKAKTKDYNLDDFKKFKGTLHLNHDDPNEFYYVLRDAVELK